MTRDDIIRMAREATDEPCPYDNGGVTWSFTKPELERFANLVAAERDKKWQVLLDEIDKYSAVCSEGIKLSGDLSLAAIDVAVAVEREAYQNVHRLLEAHQAALEASEKPGPWPAKEVIAKAVAAEREACARMAEECVDIERLADAIRARGEQQTPQERTPDYLEKCPNCNGPADNGFDRSWPDPNPYYCTKCMKAMEY